MLRLEHWALRFPRHAAKAETAAAAEERVDLLISFVLRSGVLVSAGLIAFGLGLMLVQARLSGVPVFNPLPYGVSPATIVRGALRADPASITELGLLGLILTPTTLVATTSLLFFTQRDRVFSVITLVVLAILVLGLIGFGA
jgi:uncharacterized membrane protein